MVTARDEINLLEMQPEIKVLGICISSQWVTLVFGALSGLIYERSAFKLDENESFPEAFDALCDEIDRLLNRCQVQGLEYPEMISVAVNGRLDVSRGLILASPGLPQWQGAPIKGRLNVKFGLPVVLLNKAAAGALVAYHLEFSAETPSLAYLQLLPELRSAFVINGDVYTGVNDLAGSLQALIPQIDEPAQAASETGEQSNPDDVAEGQLPLGLFSLVEALKIIIHMLDVQVIVLGDLPKAAGEKILTEVAALLQPLEKLRPDAMPRIVSSKYADKLDEMIALMPAMSYYLKRKITA